MDRPIAGFAWQVGKSKIVCLSVNLLRDWAWSNRHYWGCAQSGSPFWLFHGAAHYQTAGGLGQAGFGTCVEVLLGGWGSKRPVVSGHLLGAQPGRGYSAPEDPFGKRARTGRLCWEPASTG